MTSRMVGLPSPALRAEVEARLPAYIAPRRWFRSKTRSIVSASLTRMFPLADASGEVALAVMRVAYATGPSEDYALVVERTGDAQPSWGLDGLDRHRALAACMAFIARGASVEGWSAEGGTARLSARTFGPIAGIEEPRPVETEQSNTSVVFGGRSILKVIRRLDDGRSPELEMSEYLTRQGFASTPPLLAALELDRGSAEPATVAVVHAYVPNEGDAWTYTLRTVGAVGAPEETAFVRRMAERVAAMHAVLAAPTRDPRFVAEPLTRREREALAAAVGRSLSTALPKVAAQARNLPAGVQARLEAVLGAQRPYARIVDAMLDVEPSWKTRVHGDLHLGQLLVQGGDFVVIDFEGEPARSLEDRKGKRSPMVDVAGMLRSLHYASLTAGVGSPWYALAKRAFLEAYDAAGGASALPERARDREALLRFFCLEKCVYELHYELDNRPDWVKTPLEGLEELMREVDAG